MKTWQKKYILMTLEVNSLKSRKPEKVICILFSSYLTAKYLNKHRVNDLGYVEMKNLNYYPLLKNINMLDTDKPGYVGHLS